MEIKIPCDDDGYVLLQCHLCGEYFKVRGSDINSDDLYQIWCPYCGLISDSYVTSEVIDVALKSATNTAMEEIYNVFKDFEKKFRKNLKDIYIIPKIFVFSQKKEIKVKINNIKIADVIFCLLLNSLLLLNKYCNVGRVVK